MCIRLVVELEVDPLEHEVLEGESDDPRLPERLARGEPARAAVGAVLASIPEEQAVEDLVVLVSAADLDGVAAELREEVLRLPGEVAALQRVRVDGTLGAIARGTVGPAGGERVDAADSPLQGSKASRVADVQTHLVRVLEPVVGLLHGSG